MLMLEHIDDLTKASAEAISNIKFDKVVVWENGGSANGQSATSNFLQNMSRTLPPMMHVMKDVAGVEIPEYFARLTPDTAASSNGAASVESPSSEESNRKPAAASDEHA